MTDYLSQWLYLHADMHSVINKNRVHYRENFTAETMATTQAVAFWCWKNKLSFATEVKLKWSVSTRSGPRPDIVIPELGTPVVEIMDSETWDMFTANKKPWYDSNGVTLIALPADPGQALKILASSNGYPDPLEASTFVLRRKK